MTNGPPASDGPRAQYSKGPVEFWSPVLAHENWSLTFPRFCELVVKHRHYKKLNDINLNLTKLHSKEREINAWYAPRPWLFSCIILWPWGYLCYLCDGNTYDSCTAYLFPTPLSVALLWELKISHGWRIYSTEISKHYKSGLLFFPLESQLLVTSTLLVKTY